MSWRMLDVVDQLWSCDSFAGDQVAAPGVFHVIHNERMRSVSWLRHVGGLRAASSLLEFRSAGGSRVIRRRQAVPHLHAFAATLTASPSSRFIAGAAHARRSECA